MLGTRDPVGRDGYAEAKYTDLMIDLCVMLWISTSYGELFSKAIHSSDIEVDPVEWFTDFEYRNKMIAKFLKAMGFAKFDIINEPPDTIYWVLN